MRYGSAQIAMLAAALFSAAVLAVAGPVFADPIVGGSITSTVPTTTVSIPDVTPDGDFIVRPAPSPNVVPAVIAKAKAFNSHLHQEKRQMRRLQDRISQYRQSAEQWDLVMGTAVRDIRSRRLAAMSLSVLKRDAAGWRKVAELTRTRAQHPPHLSDWLCIHRYEATWHYDKNAPGHNRKYDGGLQMSVWFQQHYGAWLYRILGTADHWTPLEQMWVAEQGFKDSGFHPWPNTARDCGLL